MKRNFRLTRTTDFQRVRRFGKSYAHPLIVLVVLARPEPVEPPPGVRVGVTAGRSVGNAVRRNRAKRVMRAAIQPYLPGLPPGWDLILIARRPLLEASFADLQAALARLLQRARLVSTAHDQPTAPPNPIPAA